MLGSLALLSISLRLLARRVIEAFATPLRFLWMEIIWASGLVMIDEATNKIAIFFETTINFARVFHGK